MLCCFRAAGLGLTVSFVKFRADGGAVSQAWMSAQKWITHKGIAGLAHTQPNQHIGPALPFNACNVFPPHSTLLIVCCVFPTPPFPFSTCVAYQLPLWLPDSLNSRLRLRLAALFGCRLLLPTWRLSFPSEQQIKILVDTEG